MALKKNIKHVVSVISRMPIVAKIVRLPFLRKQLEQMPGADLVYGNAWDNVHPFDIFYQTDTSGVLSAKELPVIPALRNQAIDYAGSQPSILRSALAQLPALDNYTFLDLGCGKGRALLVASEFSFQDILGIELSPLLAEIARNNAEIVAHRFPHRTPVRVQVADASSFPLPAGNLVIFLYHPFGAELVAKVVSGVESALAAEERNIYIIYYNPVFGHCFDASSLLQRRFAGMIPYGTEEIGYGPDETDPLVIWHGGVATPPPISSANAQIVVVKTGVRVTLVTA